MYEDMHHNPVFWKLEVARLRRSQPRRPTVTQQLVNRLSLRDCTLWNSFEMIDKTAARGDRAGLESMRRAVTARPASDLQRLLLANIGRHLDRGVSPGFQTRATRPGYRSYLEVRPDAAVSVR